MEGRRGAVALPFSLGNFTLDYTKSVASCCCFCCMEEMSLKLMDAEMKSSGNSLDGDNDDCSFGDSGSDVSFSVALGSGEMRSEGSSSLVATTSEDDTIWLAREEDGSSSLEGDAMPDSCSLSVVSDASSLCGDDFLAFEANFLEVERELASRILVSRDSGSDDTVLGDSPSVSVREGAGDVAVVSKGDVRLEKGPGGKGGRSIFELDCVPLWGLTSVCGRRPEMEDAVAALPRLLKIPIRMLTGDHGVDGTTCLSHLTGHFFGVYDGHGGSQVDTLFVFFDHVPSLHRVRVTITSESCVFSGS